MCVITASSSGKESKGSSAFSSEGELSEDVEAASETTTDQEDQTKDRECGGEKELTKETGLVGGARSTRHVTPASRILKRALVEEKEEEEGDGDGGSRRPEGGRGFEKDCVGTACGGGVVASQSAIALLMCADHRDMTCETS
ncbi:zinc finger homeobox protein 3 isoform X1 [Tachysurus ichikawai]